MSFPPAAFGLPVWDVMASGRLDASYNDSLPTPPQQVGGEWHPHATQSHDGPLLQLPYPFPGRMPPTGPELFSPASSIASMSYTPTSHVVHTSSSHIGQYQQQAGYEGAMTSPIIHTHDRFFETSSYTSSATRIEWQAASNPALLATLPTDYDSLSASLREMQAAHQRVNGLETNATGGDWLECALSTDSSDSSQSLHSLEDQVKDDLELQAPEFGMGDLAVLPSFTMTMGAPYMPVDDRYNFWLLPQSAVPSQPFQPQNLYSPPLSAAGSPSPPSTPSSEFSRPVHPYSVPPSRETSFSPASGPSTAPGAPAVGPIRRPRGRIVAPGPFTRPPDHTFRPAGPGAQSPVYCASAGHLDDAAIQALIRTAVQNRAPPRGPEESAPTAYCEWGACPKTKEMRTDSLVKHIQSGTHLNRQIACPTCGRGYVRADVLRKHLKGGAEDASEDERPKRQRGKKNTN
ncbi:hypothetical protein C8F04DRAFT_1248573 [Mycena alexandri]|uniref:C2H2-type domain-containing protein n=1 Tax=Mycena alexandri TaxID=1745969 RepID=A0AAD6TLE4_9AGAR|nr:hypothetical protein C8F04DRAFT_1248573 [Mycena alexandri]